MAALDVDGIRHLAKLAALSLTPEEEASMAGEIARVVAFVDELTQVETDDVTLAPLVPPAAASAWRADAPAPGLAHADALSGAPETAHGGFVVPTFVGG